MRLSTEIVELDEIRTDGGTQVREKLDGAWVAELRELFEEGGHDIPPLLVVRDRDGALWLADGFHRLEALKQAGKTGAHAVVRSGSIEMAKMLAAQANKNGLLRTAGDKKRAIQLALSTAEGRKMGVRELARHCGVSSSWAGEVIAGRPVPDAHVQVAADDAAPAAPTNGNRVVAALWARIDAELRANPGVPSSELAERLGCDRRAIAGRRKALGLPPISKGVAAKARHQDTRDAVTAMLRDNPKASTALVVEHTGAGKDLVSKVRAELGLSRRSVDDVARERLSSKERHPHPNDGAEVVRDNVVPIRPRTDASKQARAAIMQQVERLGDEDRWSLAVDLAGRWPRSFALPSPGEVAGQ